MPENEFEKKVSSEMQDLKFKPTENVWLRVEERIKKKKKRRVFVIIFLLAGLSLLGYWQRSNLFGENENDIEKTVQKGSPREKQKEENSKAAEDTNSNSTIKQNTEATNDLAGNDKLKGDKSVVDQKGIVVSKKEIDKPKKNKDENKVNPASENKIEDGPEVSIAITSADSKKRNTVVDDGKTISPLAVKTDAETIVKQNDVIQSEVKPTGTGKTDTLLNPDQAKAPSAPIVKKDPSEKKWKWGFHITPGISSLNDNEISFGGASLADALNYQSPTVGSGPAAPPPVRQKPSEVKAGFAFQAGAFAQRQLSSRTSLSLGLQYGYYSNILHIGNRRNSLSGYSQVSAVLDRNANQVYNAGGDTTKYTNHYHFIELPFIFQWQLNKNKTKPFIWSIGFTVGQLIASNAIMYDTAFNGVYYENKRQLNKTQFSFSTGFSWTIANSKQLQWNLGPVADFHLTKLVDNPFESKRYLFFVGLRTGVLLNSKK